MGRLHSSAVDSAPAARYAILIPVYNDWGPLRTVMRELDAVLADKGLEADLLIVNDCSSDVREDQHFAADWKALRTIRVLELRRNISNQRAVAVGLTYLYEEARYRGVLLMDGDGQDNPADVPRLIEAFEKHDAQRCIFAERTKRKEGMFFRVAYRAFTALHQLLVGPRLRIGNFGIVPFELLKRVVVSPELWSHYAATVIHSRIPLETISTTRAQRVAGESKMRFTDLFLHGLRAIAVHTDYVSVRLLLMIGAVSALLVGALIATVAIRMWTDLAIPGWATNAGGLSLIALAQSFIIGLLLVFGTVNARQLSSFLPIRDCPYFIDSVDQVFPNP